MPHLVCGIILCSLIKSALATHHNFLVYVTLKADTQKAHIYTSRSNDSILYMLPHNLYDIGSCRFIGV